ncbi:MAG TPA: aminopeptidase [Candidatus Syntrophosphaera sp.]|jgi:hypothetical protein|nr:aminopeptidase [Candidatus Cloacimonadota bacterium]HOZ00248.1 aminopeptidase [Candidatus Syntrophosphaera sp.]
MTESYFELQAKVSAPQPKFAMFVERLQALEIPESLPLKGFFSAARDVVLQSVRFKELLTSDSGFSSTPLSLLEELNSEFYAMIEPETGYKNSPGNPDWAASQYGSELGGLVSALYSKIRFMRQHLLKDDYLDAVILTRLFFTLYEKATAGNTKYSEWLEAYRTAELEDFETRTAWQVCQRFCPEADYYREVIQTADFSDLRYLYRYGYHLSQHDLAMAEYVNKYPADELASIARFIAQCFVDGFTRAKKDYTKKRYANLIIPCGLERLGKLLIAELDKLGLVPLVAQPLTQGINRQYGYDHRFDNSLVLDRAYVDLALKTTADVLESQKEKLGLQGGPVVVELFGETPFVPEAKSAALKLSPQQQLLYRELLAKNSELQYKYYRRDEASFTIIAFPSPEIGTQFKEIFADTLKINLLDSNRYAKIQQNIIDVLDTAEFVHVKGKPGNDTDIMVRMHPLADPAKQTNFENCVADVNIPVGEVFTSPLLEGTTGTLHVEDIYLGALRYYNLRVHFQDGWVKDYSCTNFADPAEGKKYIQENLLLPHESLPIGEFAIGTNTLAYMIARKYGIQALLPILIIEKMGPHFAIGDTCFSHEEDAPHPSFVNGKEMIAVENEKSATRKSDPVNAYTQKHMDITLPYDMLESIAAVAKDGSRTLIIQDGRFVVPGTEELNVPLDEGV